MKKISLLLILIIIQNTIYSQCTVNIGSDRIICEGTELTLTANSDAVSFLWSTSETTKSISISPTTETIYSITATCNDGSTVSDNITVFVNSKPNVSLGNNKIICKNEDVNITVNWAEHYLWSNGSNESNITVSPDITTDYWVLITDANNCKNSDTITVIVNPLPSVTLNNNQNICKGESKILNATSGASNYLWNTGETTSSITVSPFVTSNYTVTVTDDNNCKKSAVTEITVNSKPNANFSHTEVCKLNSTDFTDLSTDDNTIINWNWTYNNNTFAEDENPNYTFTNSGVFDVQLIVKSDKECSDTIVKSVQVFKKPVSDFSISSEYACTIPANVQLTDKSTEAVAWSWSFDNGQTSNFQFPNVDYSNVGQYKIQLIVESAHSCRDTSFKFFNIYQKPIVSFTTDVQKGCEPLAIQFQNTSQNYDSTIWYIDNNLIYTQNCNFDIEGEGFHSITLTVLNEFCSDIVTQIDYIEIYNAPVIDFEYTEENNPFPYGLLYFKNNTTDADNYYWTFGDSISSDEFEPEHRYTTYGKHNVTLEAINSITNCKHSLTKEINLEYFEGLFVPNALMPSSNTIEAKVFLPKGRNLTDYHIYIYNRAGSLMWESTLLNGGIPGKGWNGTLNGTAMPAGVYLWKIDATFDNGIKWKGQLQKNGKFNNSGYLTLIR